MTGNPDALTPLDVPKPWVDKALAKLGGPTFGYECVIWPGKVHPNRYPIFGVTLAGVYRAQLVHRGLYAALRGPIPASVYCCHRCDDRTCVNPYHIFLGSSADNMRDASRKGRMNPAYGQRSNVAKVTEADVLAIRLSAEPSHIIAPRFGVSPTPIRHIRNGRRWGWFKPETIRDRRSNRGSNAQQ